MVIIKVQIKSEKNAELLALTINRSTLSLICIHLETRRSTASKH
jgi:hypothetical protein